MKKAWYKRYLWIRILILGLLLYLGWMFHDVPQRVINCKQSKYKDLYCSESFLKAPVDCMPRADFPERSERLKTKEVLKFLKLLHPQNVRARIFGTVCVSW